MSAPPRRLAFVTGAAALVLMTLLLAAFEIWGKSINYEPRFDLVVDIDAPKRLGCFHAYINSRYDAPSRACLTRDGRSSVVLPNIPSNVSTMRLDLGFGGDIEFVLHSIKFTTSRYYTPRPAAVIREFLPAEIATWTPFDMRMIAPGRYVTVGSAPKFQEPINADLAAAIDANAGKPAWLMWQPALLLLGFGVAFLTAFITWREYRNAPAAARDTGFIVALASLGFLLTIVSAFPGHTNFDEFYSLAELWSGAVSDLHPPIQVLTWAALMDFGRLFGLGAVAQAGLMLIVQAAVFWSSAALVASWLTSKRLGRILLLVLAISPISLVYLGHIGKDSQQAIALLAAVACMGQAIRHRSMAILVLSLAPLFYGFAVRSNAPAAVLPLCLFGVLIAFDLRGIDLRSWRRKAAVALGTLLLFAALFGASRILSSSVVKNRCCFAMQAVMTPVYDLMGVSVRINQNLVPPAIYQDPNYSLETIRQGYGPTTFSWDGLVMVGPNQAWDPVKAWLEAMWQHPKEFLQHRLAHLSYFFGLHSGPPPFPYMSGFYIG
ncbi:MAG: hypothetical protein M3Z35_04310, partial [Nitrospirota bacterium]|nr:hypothetical protein [Nitrospirota bacterium]